MKTRTILPGRCRHYTTAAPKDQRQIYKYIFIFLMMSKRNRSHLWIVIVQH